MCQLFSDGGEDMKRAVVLCLVGLTWACGDGALEVHDDQEILEGVGSHTHGEILYVTDAQELASQLQDGRDLDLEPTRPFHGVLLHIAGDVAPSMQYVYMRMDGTWSEPSMIPVDNAGEETQVDGSITLPELAQKLRIRFTMGADRVNFVRAEFIDASLPEGRLTFDDDWDEELAMESLDPTIQRLEISRAGRWTMPADVAATANRQRTAYNGAPAWRRSNCSGSFRRGTRVLSDFLKANFDGVRSYGGYSCRQNTANRSKMSVHGTGRAVDLFVPLHRGDADNDLGDPVANWLAENAEDLGVQLIIWDRSIWSGSRSSNKFRRYGGPHPHHDHLHVELTEEGAAMRTAWFRNGGPGTRPDTGPVTCNSNTLGRRVPAGECVQMNYNACGGGTCNWAKCSDSGSWQCVDTAACDGSVKHAHTDCAAPDPVVPDPVEPDPVEPDPVEPSRPSGASCTSRTLGRDVLHGDCVQMNYNSCGGAGTCLYAMCDDGAWQCIDQAQCTFDKFNHADCAPAPEPPAPTGASCFSRTLGRSVPDGDGVQMSYRACGGTCEFATCTDGSWTCSDAAPIRGTRHSHRSCR